MKRMLFVAMAMLAALGILLTGCSTTTTTTPTATPTSSPTPTPTASERVVTVAGNFGNVPWEFKENDVMTGFEYEMVMEAAKLMGVTLEWIDMPFSGIVPGLVSEKWDMGASSIWVTAQRAAQLDYADPYYTSGTILCTLKDAPITKLEDMKDKVFGAESGSTNDAWLKEILPTYGPFEIKGYDRIQDGMLDLQAGRINGMVGDSPTVLYYIKDKPDFVASLTAPGVAFYQAVYFQKGSPLRDEFNTAQNKLKTNGTLAAIYKKWFSVDPAPDSATVKVFTEPYVPTE
jgi:polar amino acid transport system substrate-binding protein